MTSYPSKINLDLLLQDIMQLCFTKDGSGAKMALPQSTQISELSATLSSSMREAIEEIGLIRKQDPLYLTINILPPDVVVPRHTDRLKDTTWQKGYPKIERWHLPVATNNDCWWWDEKNGKISMPKGHWYGPVPYWIPHQVGNLGIIERVHFVVDLDTTQEPM